MPCAAFGTDVDVGVDAVETIAPGWVVGGNADVCALASGTGVAPEVQLVPIRICEGNAPKRELRAEQPGFVVVAANQQRDACRCLGGVVGEDENVIDSWRKWAE